MKSGVMALVVLAAAYVQQGPPTFRSGVSTVPIYATVRATDGRLVTDLTRDDFEIRDNGALRDVTVFSSDIVPITVALLLDMSGSVEGRVVWLRDAANAFIDALLPGDRVRFGTFGAEIALSPRLTGDKAYLRRVISEEIWPGGSTPLWDAIDRAMSSLGGEQGRRVILAITDGFDSTPSTGLTTLRTGLTTANGHPMSSGLASPRVGKYGDVQRRATSEQFMVYAVGKALPPKNAGILGGMSGEMISLTSESGGGFQVFSPAKDAIAAMVQVAEELHRQYLIGFSPAVVDNKTHKLELKVKRPGMTVQARRSYVADGK